METIALSREVHPKSLERLAADALSSGNAAAAFMLADRRCRILPHAQSHHFVLRAEALMRLGDREGAIADITSALALSPDDVQANRRMLSWGDAAQKEGAARTLITTDDDAAVLGPALAVLHDHGRAAVGAVRMTDDAIIGWAAWDGKVAPRLIVSDRPADASVTLVADPDHPLADGSFEHAAGFHLHRTASSAGCELRLTLSDMEFFRTRAGANARAMSLAINVMVEDRADTDITVIIPIYRDLQATRACLASVQREIGARRRRRAILVNDASPELELERYVAGVARQRDFTLLKNEINLGFAGSVNQALAQVAGGDVLLLNADTILPPGCLTRMTSVARSDPSIGTVTPLSNNGEFTSFPVPFEANPLLSSGLIDEIDQIAARVNRRKVIDLPNGIGFCLYVTRACLQAVGPLSQAYQRGYLEDVDFCLRARERGFRNVCAPSIYVGHHGTRSFGADKRALVVRNITVAEQRFPDYRQECALFIAADPLRSSRAAIERKLPAEHYDHLLISGDGLLEPVAKERAAQLLRRRKRVLLVCVEQSQLRVRGAAGKVPQSLTFARDSKGLRDLCRYLEGLPLARIEILEPGAVSGPLLRAIEGLGKPIRLLAADAGLVCPRGTLIQPDGRLCATLGTDGICSPCASKLGQRDCQSREQWLRQWQAIKAGDVGVLDERAKPAAAFLSSRARPPVRPSLTKASATTAGLRSSRLGVIVQGSTVDEFRLIREFLRAALCRLPNFTFVVLGQTADDLALMAIGNVFVSGAIEPATYPTAIRQYGIERLLLPLRRPLYGHPAGRAAAQSQLPMAYFDWSFGQGKARDSDLAIDPRCGSADLVELLGCWPEAKA